MPKRRQHAKVLMLTGVIVALATFVAPALACEPVDHFQMADALVVGKVNSVRQTAWRVLFWGSNEWQAEVVTLRRLEGKSPGRFIYYASDDTFDGCVRADIRPHVGDELVFPLQKVDSLYVGRDGYVREKPNWNGRYAAYAAAQ